MEENRLVQLNLQLHMPDYWATRLAERFPKVKFRIHKSSFVMNNTRSGIIEIDESCYSQAKDFLEKGGVDLEEFDASKGFYHFTDPQCPLAEIISSVPCLEKYPITLKKDEFDIRLQLPSRYVSSIVSKVKRSGISLLGLAKFSVDIELGEMLTPKQKEVLKQALVKGYYTFPKKICLNDFASSISLSPSTLCVHLQKIEHKIMSHYASTS